MQYKVLEDRSILTLFTNAIPAITKKTRTIWLTVIHITQKLRIFVLYKRNAREKEPMLDKISQFIIDAAEILCGYPLFFLLIGGGLYLFLSSGMVSLRRLPAAVKELRKKTDGTSGQISSAQALASVVAATIGLGNIAGVAIALVMGGPGAIFWMWVSAIVGMATKYHEGVLAIVYKGHDDMGRPQGGPMHIIERGLGPRWKPLARFFAIAGLFGTLCIMNANQLTEAFMTTFTTPEGIASSDILGYVGSATGLSNTSAYRLLFGCAIAAIVAIVILGGIKRIARVASVMVPFMVGLYFIMVLYIILSNLGDVPAVFQRIFAEAFNLRAGFGALAGIAIIGARSGQRCRSRHSLHHARSIPKRNPCSRRTYCHARPEHRLRPCVHTDRRSHTPVRRYQCRRHKRTRSSNESLCQRHTDGRHSAYVRRHLLRHVLDVLLLLLRHHVRQLPLRKPKRTLLCLVFPCITYSVRHRAH